MQARQIELGSGQYALTVAVELAKKACKTLDFQNPTIPSGQVLTENDVRALAYVLAERVLVVLSERKAESSIG